MIRSLKDLVGYSLGAADDEIGKVRDFLLDDQQWQVRYLVADTGSWLSGRTVLLSPAVIGRPDADARVLPVNLTTDQVRHSPPIEEHQPVSRQKEAELAQHYGWPIYWNPAMVSAGAGMMGGPWMTAPVVTAEQQAMAQERLVESRSKGDPHLRSAREVIGYHVQAADGEIGHVEDFVLDDTTWVVQYVVVDTRNWWPARKVTMLPMWISGVSWDTRQVRFDLPRETIRNGPEYDPAAPINQDHETRFYDYYGRPADR